MFPLKQTNLFLVFVILLLSAVQVQAQQAPGGVFSPSPGLWLKCDNLTPTNGNSITSNWVDAYSSGNDAIYRLNASTSSALYQVNNNNINFNKSIHFNGNDWFDSPLNINTNTVNIFVVYKKTSPPSPPNPSLVPLWGNEGGTSNDKCKQATTTSITKGGNNNNPRTYTSANSLNEVYINHISSDETSNNNSFVYINGKEERSYSTNNTQHNSAHSGIFIGKSNNDNFPTSPTGLGLEVAEFIAYTGALDPAKRKRITSYLGIKYGVTLDHDYTLSDNNIAWDKANNSAYHRNVAGIGRDDLSELNQQKSKSEEVSHSHLTIEHTNSFTQDKSMLIWGCKDCATAKYNDINTTNAPQGYQLSKKRWKAQNYQNKIGSVDVTLPTPTLNSTQNIANLRLIVGNNAQFSGTLASYQGTINNNKITFNNVTLPDNSYFTVGLEEPVYYLNNDPLAPQTYEACLGSEVTFYYENLLAHPDRVRMNNASGTGTIIVMPTSNIHISPYTGSIDITIPPNAGTGPVELLNGNNLIHTYAGNLLVHNPELHILPQNNPICATDTVPLVGIPAGGAFSTNIVGLTISGDSLIAPTAGWSNANTISKPVSIYYTYRPEYLDGTACLSTITDSLSIEIKDNRLSDIEFRYIIKKPYLPTAKDTLALHSDVISSITPNLLTSSFTFPVHFSGTYVYYDSSSNYYKLHTNQAATNNLVTMTYNNGGCIGTATGELNVYPPLRMIGLLDTICSEANAILFTRDTLRDYRQYDTTTHQIYLQNSNYFTKTNNYTYNKIIGVTTDNPAYQVAIDTIQTTPNGELYRFDPTQLPPGVDSIAIQMRYSTFVNVTSNDPAFLSTSYVTHQFVAFDTVYISPRPSPSISGLENAYCENAILDTLKPSPFFEHSARTFFRVKGTAGIHNNLAGQLVRDTLLDPRTLYNSLVPSKNNHLELELTYVVARHGCRDSITDTTQIIAPIRPYFTPKPAYCTNEQPSGIQVYSHLSGNLPPTGGGGTFFQIPGLDTFPVALFSPSVAGPGNHLATYQYTDDYGCTGSYTDTLFVREPPNIELMVGSPNRTNFCANETHVILQTRLLSGAVADSISYTGGVGVAIIDSIWNPSGKGPGGGTVKIEVEFTDTFGCAVKDHLFVNVHPIPSITIDSLFNNNHSIVNGQTIYDHKYCGNDSSFIIAGTPSHLTGQRSVNRITGRGIVLRDSTYYYDPSLISANLIASQSYIDTVSYFYTDHLGCKNTIHTKVNIDTIPEVSLIGLDSSYCINYATNQLLGSPNTSVGNRGVLFGGPGIHTNTGIFTPSLAGTGQKILSYSFTDNNFCKNIAYDTTIVHSLPTPSFGGYQNQYCTAAANDALSSLNPPSLGSSFSFWGSIISQPIGVLDPSLDSTGLKTIFYAFTDSLGCTDTASANIFIHPSPKIIISGLDSAYCFNGSIDDITVFPVGTLDPNSDPNFSVTTTGISFNPNRNTSGTKSFTYIHTDPITTCADTINRSTFVYRPLPLSYGNLNSFYCETNDTIVINGHAAGGIFSGPGIVDSIGLFIPSRAGGGIHSITYSAKDSFLYGTNSILVCPIDSNINVRVKPLPIPTILSPSDNSRFCSTDSLVHLQADSLGMYTLFTNLSGGIDSRIDSFFVPNGTGSYNLITDTTFFFNPSTVGDGIHTVTYIAIDSISGCQDSIKYTYHVDSSETLIFVLDSIFCQSDDSVALVASPGGGVFLRNQDTLHGIPPYFNPNASNLSMSNSVVDTIIYSVNYGACFTTDTQLVHIHPTPQVSFLGDTTRPHNVYCLNMDSIPLIYSPSGGTFTGPGVLSGDSIFRPNIAGIGHHIVAYEYGDTATNCSNIATNTFHVFAKPNVDFDIIGGCVEDSILFLPNNQILNLNNTLSNNQIIDSITKVIWKFGDGNSSTINHSSNSNNNSIDSIYHVFGNAGIGINFVQLYVENQHYCIDSHSVRLVISPKVNSFPYVQDFETNHGHWYAESKSNAHALLWEWGIDSTPGGISPNSNNKCWITAPNQSYSTGENAWVYGPCIDIKHLERPMIKFNHWSNTRNFDGVVLEYQKRGDTTWQRLGNLGQGINWFNNSYLASAPGNQTVFPVGWSGNTNKWVDSRYRLDRFQQDSIIRLRFAFSSLSNSLGSTFYDGFAFDSVWIGSRTRNVLLETTANIEHPGMDSISSDIYNLVFHTSTNKDLVLLEYHTKEPSIDDPFYQFNSAVADARAYYYGISTPARAYIDGQKAGASGDLVTADFERDMLQTPKFDIVIDSFYYNNLGNFIIQATTKALEDISSLTEYQIFTVITEDSLQYINPLRQIKTAHAVVREDNREKVNSRRYRTWAKGDTAQTRFSWSRPGLTYAPLTFQAVVFIQNNATKEIYQVKTSRDVSGYSRGPDVAIDKIQAKSELDEIRSMNLYPNPAKDAFRVSFKEALKQDYNWKLVDLRGVEVKSGVVQHGKNSLEVNNYNFPTGVYIFVVYNDRVFSQRKVIINQN